MMLNKNQTAALWIGILVFAIAGFYPPWVETAKNGEDFASIPREYAPLFNPPISANSAGINHGISMDFTRLADEWIVIAVVAFGLVTTLASAPIAQAKAPQTSASTGGASNSAGKESSKISSKSDAQKKSIAEVVQTNFPAGQSIGDILAESPDDPDYWEFITEAKGLVTVPRARKLQLEVKKEGAPDLKPLAQLPQDFFYSVDLSDSKVTDGDLAAIVSLNKLKELDLSRTSVTKNGIENVAKLSGLERVWLDGTTLDGDDLTALIKNKGLKKLSIIDSNVNDEQLKALRKANPSCEIVTS